MVLITIDESVMWRGSHCCKEHSKNLYHSKCSIWRAS